MNFKDTFRLWWQKPKNIADIEEDRAVSFLELFYDLAYVVIIIQLTHTLVGHLALENLFGYVAVYAMVWFAWINGSLYHELHGNNDIRSRMFTFLQMFALVWMGIFVHSALTPEGYQGFAFAYAGFLATLTYLWWRTGVHDPEHRPLSTPYTLAFLGTTIAFLYSTQQSVEVAHQIWFGAIAFSLLMPFAIMKFRVADSGHVEAVQRIRPSLVERFGLLTIIVLGENLISIVGGATHEDYFPIEFVALISLCIAIVFSLWWLYFDFVSRRQPVQTTGKRMSWVYLHLPLTMSIGLTAVGLLSAIEHPEHFSDISRWFVVGPVVLFLLANTLLITTLQIREQNGAMYRKGIFASGFSIVALIMVGVSSLSLLQTLLVVWILLILPVYAGFRVWLARARNTTHTPSI